MKSSAEEKKKKEIIEEIITNSNYISICYRNHKPIFPEYSSNMIKLIKSTPENKINTYKNLIDKQLPFFVNDKKHYLTILDKKVDRVWIDTYRKDLIEFLNKYIIGQKYITDEKKYLIKFQLEFVEA